MPGEDLEKRLGKRQNCHVCGWILCQNGSCPLCKLIEETLRIGGLVL